MESEVRMNEPKRDKTRREMRLAAFAKSHFVISGIGFAVGLMLLAVMALLSDYIVYALAEIVLLALYAVAGFWHARNKQWRFSCFKEAFWAFLDPALIAWGWAALVLASLFLNALPLLICLFFASMFLASPSSIMVLLALGSGVLEGECGFVLCAILAGGVPPLLFFLGSLCGSGKRSKTEEENQSTGQECMTDV